MEFELSRIPVEEMREEIEGVLNLAAQVSRSARSGRTIMKEQLPYEVPTYQMKALRMAFRELRKKIRIVTTPPAPPDPASPSPR